MPELQERSALGRQARIVNMAELGKALTELKEPPVKAMVVYNSNPASIAPNQTKVLAGMRRDDLFTVVLEQFQTDTADYADILLPSTTFLEHTDLYRSYGHYYLQLARPALDAPGEARSNVEVFRDLALRMGFDDQCFRDSEDIMMRSLLGSGHPFLADITLERLDQEHSIRLNVSEPGAPFLPFAEGGFGTPSGKCEFGAETLAYAPPVESRFGRRIPARPLSARADFVEKRRQHELHLRQSSAGRRRYRAAPPEWSRRAGSRHPVW
jgi:anaerobic selenocysteine-containing dehydrogenase